MKNCFIFDIDGTLADCSHRLHHIVRTDGQAKDWAGFFAGMGGDVPIAPIVEVAMGLMCSGALGFFKWRARLDPMPHP